MNKEELVEKYTVEKNKAAEGIGALREQITRLQVEERRLIEVHLRLEGCLLALSELSEDEDKPLRVVGENISHYQDGLPPPEEEKEEA